MTSLSANLERQHYSFEQYLALLQSSKQRLEYDHGYIYALAGSSANHADISANMWRVLDDALGNDTCRAYMVDRVVRLTPDITVMPDVVVTCDPEDQGDAFFLNSPHLVVEVLSKSTSARDRTHKLVHYQTKQTIQEIIFISQYVQHVEVIARTPLGWDYQEYEHEESFSLASLNITIHVSDIYRRLSIPIKKRKIVPLEIIEAVDESEDI